MKIGSIRGVDLYLRPYVLVFFMIAWIANSLSTVLLADRKSTRLNSSHT